MKFQDKVAVVTGGSSGIGYATAELLARSGCRVYNFDIQKYSGTNIKFTQCNVGNYNEVKTAIKYVCDNEKQIDLLFSNAGIYLPGNVEEASLDDFEKILATNLKGTFYILKEVLPIMKKQKFGNIVLMGSDQCFIGKEKSAVYGMTKGAIGQLTRSTAIDYAQYNIRVNCVCPGSIETPMHHKAIDDYSKVSGISKEELYKMEDLAQPIRRVGQPVEVAKVVLFLLSNDSSYMTGTLVSIDGGLTCQ